MKYFQYPTTYNWSNMPDFNGNNTTSILLADIGASFSMDYSCDGSGTQTSKTPLVFQAYGYSNANFSDYNYNTVVSEINQNKPVILAGGEKEYWAGIFPYYDSGHAWVSDGYIKGYECFYDNDGNVDGGYGYLLFHMNWGWGYSNRYLNGYFGLNNFSVNGNSYNYKRKMVYGIRI